MDAQILIAALAKSRDFLERSTSTLTEADAEFAPAPGMFTSAQVLAHVALTIDWFIDGAFVRPEGFSMDFEALDREARTCTSLEAARAMCTKSYERAAAVLAEQTPAVLASPLPEGPVMGGAPRLAAVSGIEEHTAHHRGALTVYARLRGHVPPMPYGE